MIGILGDVHGRFDDLNRIFEKNPHISHWFQVGDLGAEDLPYPELPSNFRFIQGNHENWDIIADYIEKSHPVFLKNGSIRMFSENENLFIVGALGGNYSSRFYEYERKNLCGDRRRHFVAQEVASFMHWGPKINILITHEAPTPFVKGGRDMGQPIINEVLAKVRPNIHFFGHHHFYKEMETDGVISIGLEYAGKSFVLYDPLSGKFERKVL
jgi:hypothetical protein